MSIKDEIKNGTARQTVIKFPGGEYADITGGFVSGSITLQRSLSENTDNVRFIGNIASKFEAEIIGIEDLSRLDISVSQNIGEYSLTLFCGRVDSCKLTDTRDSRKIVAYDGLYYIRDMNVAAWYNALAFPVHINELLLSLLKYAGITPAPDLSCRQDFEVLKTIDTNSLTFGTVIDAVCEVCGGFGIMDAEGRYNIVYLTDKESSLEVMSGAPLEQYNVRPVDSVIVRDNEAAVGGVYGVGTNPYYVQGNMLVYGKSEDELKIIAKALYDTVSGHSWKPCSLDMPISDPTIGCDGIIYNVSTPQGDSYKTYFFTSSQKGAQMLEQTLEAFGGEYRTAAPTDTGGLFTNQLIIKLYDVLEADYVKTKNLSAEVAKFGYVTADNFGAKYAKIDLSNVEKEYVGTLLANIGLLTSATIEEGHVTGYLDSVKINAGMIKTGTLAVDRLVLNGTNESLIFALNNIGNLTSTHTDTIDGGLITERTITADHIVAGTITSNEIAAGTITSNKLNTSEIFSNSAILNQIFAQDITATGSITSPILKSVDYAYKGTGHSYSTSGMKIDLVNKEISTPNLYIKGTAIPNKSAEVLRACLNSDECRLGAGFIGLTDGKDSGWLYNMGVSFHTENYKQSSWYGCNKLYIYAHLDSGEYKTAELEEGTLTLSYTPAGTSVTSRETTISAGGASFVAKDNSVCNVLVGNSLRTVGLTAGTVGDVGLWDNTNQKWILYSNTSQKVTVPHPLSVTGAISATGALAASSITATSGSVVAAANVYAGTTSDTVTRSVYARNSLRSVRLLANASGVIGLYNDTDAVFLLQSSTANAIQIGESSKCSSIKLSHTNGYASFAGNGMELFGGTPYIDFHFGGSGQDYTSRIIENESGVLMSMGTFGTNKNIRFGCESASTTYAIMTKWKDGNRHNVVERNADGLTCYFGWAGSDTYLTRTVLRARNIEFNTPGQILPTNDAQNYLGNGSRRFKQIFAVNGAIATSDRAQKRDIDYDLKKMDAVFDALKPCSFYRVGGDRQHWGLIAQDVEQTLFDNGITIDDVGIVCRDHVYVDGKNDEKIYQYNDDGTPKYNYGLRYEELHGIEIYQIQALKKRVAELEKTVSELTLLCKTALENQGKAL